MTIGTNYSSTAIPSFDTVALLKTINIQAGELVNTEGYITNRDRGGCQYLIKTAAQATADGDTIDGYINFTLNNSNVAIKQHQMGVSCATYAEMLALNPDAFPLGSMIQITDTYKNGFFKVDSGTPSSNGGTTLTNATWTAANKFLRRMNDTDYVNVRWFGAVGDGSTDDSAAFTLAANTGRAVLIPYGEYVINSPVTFSNHVKGLGRYTNQTHIILTGTGQLIVGDAYAQWDGFRVSTAVNNLVMIKNSGMSYWVFTNFLLDSTGGSGQVGIQFDCGTSDIYFNTIDQFSIICSYPVKINGDIDSSPTVKSFNSNTLGKGSAGNKWYNFATAITIEMGTGVCDGNEFGGYFESGTNIFSLVSSSATGFNQNRIKMIVDAVTRIWNSSVAITNWNYWEFLDVGQFTYSGTRPQNQIMVGPQKTKVRATDTSSTPALVNAVEGTMTFDSETYDIVGELVNTTGIFTATETGYYHVDASAITQGYTWPAASKFEMRLYKNASVYCSDKTLSETASAVTVPFLAKISADVFLTAGDTLRIKLIHNRGANTSLDSDPTYNYINIHKLVD